MQGQTRGSGAGNPGATRGNPRGAGGRGGGRR
jgi:hypothetical protein